MHGRTKKRGVECVASDYKRDCHESQVTRGLNIVADWWTGASSQDSHTNFHHTVGRTSTVLYRAQYVKIQEKKNAKPNL